MNFMIIKKVKAIRIIDSRGYPTLKVFLWGNRSFGWACVPSGTSTGKNEVFELRDKTKKDFFGNDISHAINNVNKVISKSIVGKSFSTQQELDSFLCRLDGTPNKSKLGGNAILGVSLAYARASSVDLDVPLWKYVSNLNNTQKHNFPLPILNIINGGVHAGNSLPFQEFQIIPNGKTFTKNMQLSLEVYHKLKEILSKKCGVFSTNVGSEGGYSPQLSSPELALDYIQDAIDSCGYAKKISLGLDCASNSFYNPKLCKYILNNKKYSSEMLFDYYCKLFSEYKLISIEDPFNENDKETWKLLSHVFSKKINIIGDDLLTTNPKLIIDAVQNNYCNSLLIKPNQIGTLAETITAFSIAKNANWNTILSHRSGDTEDPFVSDLAYGLNCNYVKFGAPCRSERTSKYNRLLEIESFDNI